MNGCPEGHISLCHPQTWPIALSGRNVIGLARPGSGKTLAFVMPAIMHMLGNPRPLPEDGPRVLMVAPTRELTVQISDEIGIFKLKAGLCGSGKAWALTDLRLGLRPSEGGGLPRRLDTCAGRRHWFGFAGGNSPQRWSTDGGERYFQQVGRRCGEGVGGQWGDGPPCQPLLGPAGA